MNYDDFLRTKITTVEGKGFEVDPEELDPNNLPHQSAGVAWALRLGRALLGWSFGLGKTRAQIEIAQAVVRRTNKPFLVVCPLGIKYQFQEDDGPSLNTKWAYVRTDAEAIEAVKTTPFLITNYERVRDGGVTPDFIAKLSGVSLDEGSVLRSLSTKTSDVFKQYFKNTPYRFVCTATPAPNEYKELIYYAEFLGIMDHGQALTRFFKRDSEHAGHLTLMPSQEQEFWLWVASWALFLTTPSDLGYPDDGYALPGLNIHWHRLSVDHSRAWNQTDDRGQRRLLLDAAGGVSQASQEKRMTLDDRLKKAQEIISKSGEDTHWIIWHHLEDERHAIKKAIPEAISVYGTQDIDEREQALIDFVRGRTRILSTKPEVAGSGCNLQYHCHSNIFLGIDYKFQDFIQAIHRTYRFLQSEQVDVHVIFAESEDAIVNVLKRKWKQHDELTARMQAILRRYGLAEQAIRDGLSRKLGVHRMEVQGKFYTAINADCVTEVRRLPENSIDLWHTSIPFGNHYEYSVQYEDFGHNTSNSQFWQQMDFLIPEMLRSMKPGRVAAIHVKDRQLYGHQTASGIMETEPFTAECIMAFRKHGWTFQGQRTIATDVVRENNSTYRLSYGEMLKDASKMSQGLPEYLLLFRKPPTSQDNARADEPVTKDRSEYSLGRWQVDAHSVWRSNGNRPLSPDELVSLYPLPEQIGAMFREEQLSGTYDYDRHVAICEELEKRKKLPKFFMLLPPRVTRNPEDMIWDDIVFMRTLNTAQSQGRRDKHICPLPFDIVERTIRLYSNAGELVADPFGGLGTVADRAIKLGRKAWICELNQAYFTDLVHYCQAAELNVMTLTLFDLANIEDAPVSEVA